jgi:transcriptional repressor NrdR
MPQSVVDASVRNAEGASRPSNEFSCERSVAIACRKRPVDSSRMDRLVTGIQRQLETLGEPEIGSARIGELVMEALKGVDSIAYIRFASVYRDFTEPKDFEDFAGSVSEAGKA